MKNYQRNANFFLKLLILRERHRPETRRLVVRLHAPKPAMSVVVPIRFPLHSASSN